MKAKFVLNEIKKDQENVLDNMGVGRIREYKGYYELMKRIPVVDLMSLDQLIEVEQFDTSIVATTKSSVRIDSAMERVIRETVRIACLHLDCSENNARFALINDYQNLRKLVESFYNRDNDYVSFEDDVDIYYATTVEIYPLFKAARLFVCATDKKDNMYGYPFNVLMVIVS